MTRVSVRATGRDPAWLVLVATVALATFYYLTRTDTVGVYSPERGWAVLTGRPLRPAVHFGLSALLLGVVPVLVARRLAGLPLAELGLGPGRWRAGIAWLVVGAPLAVAAGRIAAASAAMQAVYPLDPSVTGAPRSFVPYALLQFLYYGAWEVLFRGVLLFGLARRFGAASANLLQTALSVTAHFGRPLSETLAAIPAGLVFGLVDLRVGSVWYVALIHWLVGVSLDWFILTT